MPYTTLAALRTARNNALKDSDWWMTSDNPNLDEGLALSRKLYRQDLRGTPQKVKVDGSNNPVLNADGNLQDIDDNVLELPTIPE
tara:strand:+ start:7631 stop:7885 length:255 start_codon:yes stop_codon:yes gene_type:complete